MTPERLAELFHATYEHLAGEYGWTRDRPTACAWPNLPENNRALTVATAAEVLKVLEANDDRPAPS